MQGYGIYIHIPFCSAKCPYCDFYSLPAQPADMAGYAAALRAAIASAPLAAGSAVDSVYLGGGTPILMGAELCSVLACLQERFCIAEDAEITLEANPNSTDQPTLAALRAAGFNRISFGLQSSDSERLRQLGRTHSADMAQNAVQMARRAGFERISLDIMLGLPDQTVDEVLRTVDFCAKLGVEHISAYMLKLEPGTLFYSRYSERDIDDDTQAEIYLATVSALEQLGYRQYEISNFARPGQESTHNLKYWQCKEYLGIGPAAASYLGGRRFVFPRDLQGFVTAKDPWSLTLDEGDGGGFEEFVMMQLRLNSGLSLQELSERFPDEDIALLSKRAEDFIPHGLLTITGEGSSQNISLTPEGMLLSNSIISHLLY